MGKIHIRIVTLVIAFGLFFSYLLTGYVFGAGSSIEERLASLEQSNKVLQKELSRLQDVNEIQKVMGRYEAVHNTTDMCETYKLFADRPDTEYNISTSTIVGFENIKKFFINFKEQIKHTDNGGIMNEHPLTTAFIEVAGDGQTAKATWYSPGHETMKDMSTGGLTATWCYGKYAGTFIKMNGKWKIWFLQWVRFFRSPYDKSWVEQTKEEIYGAQLFDENGNLKPFKEGVYFSPYTTDKVFRSIPAAPQPYETWTEKEKDWWKREPIVLSE